MAYVNVSLPVGEGRVFKLPPYGRERKVSVFTIDEEKDTVLFKGVVDRDNPDDNPFYFYYKGKIIEMTLYVSKRIPPNTVVWSMRWGIVIPKEFDREEVLSEIREAVKAYGCSGMCKEDQELWKRKFKQENPNGFALTDF